MDLVKSFFQPSEKRKPAKFAEEEDDKHDAPAPDVRRKWSISRSGRMKQANKKRHGVTTDHYGETCTPTERPTSVEYHVNPVTKPTPPSTKPVAGETGPSEPKSPEEEIDSIFEVLDKVDKAS